MWRRQATWSGLGTDVSGTTDVQEVIRLSGLDYTVEKQPVFLQNGVQIPGRCATVKKESGQPIGIVSKGYEIYQNADAFDFISNIPDIEFESAGETGGGLVYIIGKLPGVTVLEDSFTPYVIFQTSHNGLFNLKATICPLRIVCQNQFAYSFRQMRNTIKIRHSRQLVAKMDQALELIRSTAVYMEGFTNTAEELAMLKLGNSNSVYQICDAFFDSTKAITERQQKILADKKALFISCYEADDNANFKGTAWGVVNAFSDYTTHSSSIKKPTQKTLENKFVSVTFDTSIEYLLECIRSRC